MFIVCEVFLVPRDGVKCGFNGVNMCACVLIFVCVKGFGGRDEVILPMRKCLALCVLVWWCSCGCKVLETPTNHREPHRWCCYWKNEFLTALNIKVPYVSRSLPSFQGRIIPLLQFNSVTYTLSVS